MLPTIRLSHDRLTMHCPYTGEPVHNLETETINLGPTVLFVDYGVGAIETKHPGVELLLAQMPDDADDDVAFLIETLDVAGGVAFIVDMGWNGVCTFAFCAPE